MGRFTLAALMLAVTFPASVAHADPTPAGASAGGTYTSPVIVVYGRPAKPMIAIVVKTPTATEAAGGAHEAFRARLLASAEAASRSLEPAAR